MKVLAAAKINLYLDVLRRRDDGYHEIETLYQPIGLWDELEIERAPDGIAVTGDDPAIPWNEDNLCHRAARLVLDRLGAGAGARIAVRKGIPSGAGFGGGSSDAAAVILALDRLYDLRLPREELLELGGRLGSDVPFFLLGGAAIGRGRGEILEPTEGLRGGWILVAKPDVTISTRWAYQNLNLLLTKEIQGATLASLIDGLRGFPDAKLLTRNSFEAEVSERFPSVGGVLAALRGSRPVLCSLSGSGSGCFAIYREEQEAREVARRIESERVFIRVVQPVSDAIRMA